MAKGRRKDTNIDLAVPYLFCGYVRYGFSLPVGRGGYMSHRVHGYSGRST